MDGQLRTALQSSNDLDSIQALSANKFPYKLWKIVNECQSGSIRWNINGRNIIVHKTQFQDEYLDPMKKTFKTSNIGSFIRQLNLYGFKKVQPACKQYPCESGGEQEVQEFHNIYFRRGRPDLVNELRRHVGVRRAKADECRQQDRLNNLDQGGTPAKMVKREPFNTYSLPAVDTGQPPSLLAVPIFADGIPYLNASLPPVLVEWDEAKKRWEPKGPAIGAVMSCTEGGDKMPEGAQMGGGTADTGCEEYAPLVAAVSDALRSVPETELQACLGPKRELQDRKEPIQPALPSDLSLGEEECPYPPCLCPTPIQPTLCTDYESSCCSPYLFEPENYTCHSPIKLESPCVFPDPNMSPLPHCSSPAFSSPGGLGFSLGCDQEYISLTFSPINLSKSPIAMHNEY